NPSCGQLRWPCMGLQLSALRCSELAALPLLMGCFLTKRQKDRWVGLIFVFMFLCLMFWGMGGAAFFDIETKRQMGGVDFCFYVFVSDGGSV
ncbi:MAG: hypothetical protein K2M54_12465, partial [Muribaculaceae bacterium]|nr:hypothetical protein [Muribaculaceae bacterium]